MKPRSMSVERSTHENFRPPYNQAPSPEEISRRQRVFAETFRRRNAIRPIDLTVAELLELGEDDVHA
jgi:hypothetical protein